jgi:CheY-like chemotaxis protein
MPDAKNILVVDDDEDICDFVSAALEGAGFNVRIALNGAQALALQRKQAADLLVTDIFMPVQDGLETIVQFKAEFPQTRIIAMSAGSRRGMQLNFLATASVAGADATLRKPFGAEQLLATVRGVLPTR